MALYDRKPLKWCLTEWHWLAIYLLSVLLEGVTLLIMHSLSCGADNSLSEHWYIYAAPPVIIAAEQEDPLT